MPSGTTVAGRTDTHTDSGQSALIFPEAKTGSGTTTAGRTRARTTQESTSQKNMSDGTNNLIIIKYGYLQKKLRGTSKWRLESYTYAQLPLPA